MKLIAFERLDDNNVHIAVEIDGKLLEFTYDESIDFLSVETHGDAFHIGDYETLMEILDTKIINLPF